MMARQLIGLHKVLQRLERQTKQVHAVWNHVTQHANPVQQGLVEKSKQFSTTGFAAWETFGIQQKGRWETFGIQQKIQSEQKVLQCRRFASSSGTKAAAGEGQAASKEGNGSKAAPAAEAASTSGQQGEPSVAMRKGRMSGPVSWGSLALLLLTGGGLLAFYDHEKRRKLETVRQGPSVGKAAIGGAFELVNQDGKKVTEKDFKGKWNLVYFGFTFCPDICPDELKKMAEAIDKVEKQIGVRVVPIFISVDPERDNVEQVGRYVKEFHPRLIGLTGSADAVKQAAKAYRVYYMKTEEEGDDYLVDHSIIQYLMDPEMEFVKFFGKNYTADTLAEGIASEIKAAAA